MLTADTITDEQILDLALSDRSDDGLQAVCDAAMSKLLAARSPEAHRAARARCAKYFNARAKAAE